jgi:hypothetical protein
VSKKKTAQKQQTFEKARWFKMGYVFIVLAVVVVSGLVSGEPTIRPTDSATRLALQNQLDQSLSKTILLGNSLLGEGVDGSYLAELTGISLRRIWEHGAASAYWYLMIKNIIAETNIRPELVIIFFINEDLTRPTLRADGPFYKERIDLLSTEDESLLDNFAYTAHLNLMERWLWKNSNLYHARAEIKESIEDQIKETLSLAMSGEGDNIDRAIEAVFSDENKDAELLTQAQVLADQGLTQPDKSSFRDFDANINQSFLPEMIKISKDSGFQLLFVRMKSRKEATPGEIIPSDSLTYKQNLTAYLEDNEIPLIDFSNEDRIRLEHFGAGNHLNRESGRIIFTELLAEEKLSLLN